VDGRFICAAAFGCANGTSKLNRLQATWFSVEFSGIEFSINMNVKRTYLYTVMGLAAVLLLTSCQGFFSNNSSGGSDNFVTSTGTPSKFAYVANTGSTTGTVSAYTVGSDNTLSAITGSPFAAFDTNSRSVVSDSDGNYIYVADVGSSTTAGSIDAYAVNRTTGALTSVSGAAMSTVGGTNPTALAIYSSNLYAAFENSAIGVSGAGVAAFTSASGALTQSTLGVASIGSLPPTSIAVDPSSGSFLYVTNGTAIYGFTIGSSGTLTATSQGGSTPLTGNSPNQIVIAPSGKFAYVASGSAGIDAYSINASTGVLTKINTYSTGGNAVALVVSPTNTAGSWLYAVNNNTNKLVGFTIGTTGALTALSSSYSTGSSPSGIAIGPSGTAVYVTNSGSNTVGLYTINADGTLNVVGTIPTDAKPQGIVVTQ
jgi:YVTN family beta-propeller protein